MCARSWHILRESNLPAVGVVNGELILRITFFAIAVAMFLVAVPHGSRSKVMAFGCAGNTLDAQQLRDKYGDANVAPYQDPDLLSGHTVQDDAGVPSGPSRGAVNIVGSYLVNGTNVWILWTEDGCYKFDRTVSPTN